MTTQVGEALGVLLLRSKEIVSIMVNHQQFQIMLRGHIWWEQGYLNDLENFNSGGVGQVEARLGAEWKRLN